MFTLLSSLVPTDPIVVEGELAPTEEVEEATTPVTHDTHDDGEPALTEDVSTAPTLVPTDPVVDEGEPAPTEYVEEVTTLPHNNPLNYGELDPTENVANDPTLIPKDPIDDDEQVDVSVILFLHPATDGLLPFLTVYEIPLYSNDEDETAAQMDDSLKLEDKLNPDDDLKYFHPNSYFCHCFLLLTLFYWKIHSFYQHLKLLMVMLNQVL